MFIRPFSLVLVCALACSLAGSLSRAADTLLYFTSPTCGPCQTMRPIIDEMLSEGVDIRKIDVSTAQGQSAASQYQVTGVPTFIVVRNGMEVHRQSGSTTKSSLMLRMDVGEQSYHSPRNGPHWNFTPKATYHKAVVKVNGGSGTYVILASGVYGIMTAAHVATATIEWQDGTRSVQTNRYDDKDGHDASFFQLDAPHPTIQPLRIATQEPKIGETLEVVGFGGPRRELRHYSGKVKGFEYDGVMSLDCAVAAGDSGGGILNSRHELVSVVSAGDDGEWSNEEARAHPTLLAPRWTPVRDFIARVLAKIGCDPSTEPGMRKLPPRYDDWYPPQEQEPLPLPEPPTPAPFPEKPYEPEKIDIPDVVFGSPEWREMQNRLSQQELASKKAQDSIDKLAEESAKNLKSSQNEILQKQESNLQTAQEKILQQQGEGLEATKNTLLKKLSELAKEKVKEAVVEKAPESAVGAWALASKVAPLLGIGGGLGTVGIAAGYWIARRRLAKRFGKPDPEPVQTVASRQEAPQSPTIDTMQDTRFVPSPVVVMSDSPPQPARVVETNKYVDVQSDRYQKAYNWASKNLAERDGVRAREVIQVLDGLMKQYLAADKG